MQTYKFSELTIAAFKSIATLHEQGVVPAMWEQMKVDLAEKELEQIELLKARLFYRPVLRMNEAMVWSRAIYPLLVLAERPGVQAWVEVPMKASFQRFTLEGIVDGVLGNDTYDVAETPYLVVLEAKRGLENYDPKGQLYGQMLAAAKLNQEQNQQTPQEIYGCYTIGDSWTFAHALVSELETELPVLRVASSREYTEKIEAEAIFQILKFIVGKHPRAIATAA
jgi:hypothetical protein